MKILLGDFNVKLGRKAIYKPTTSNESLHQESNDNGVGGGGRKTNERKKEGIQ
jgi:hypothetical protein